jgi:hypothetical protein
MAKNKPVDFSKEHIEAVRQLYKQFLDYDKVINEQSKKQLEVVKQILDDNPESEYWKAIEQIVKDRIEITE